VIGWEAENKDNEGQNIIMTQTHDLIIVGSGPGGYVAAIRGAQRGAKVALVEKRDLGGTCLNRGCIPTKTIVRDAELYRDLVSGEFGVAIEGQVKPDWPKIAARKLQVVQTLVGGIAHLLDTYGVEQVVGSGVLERDGQISVSSSAGKRYLSAPKAILATGSVPALAPIPGADLPGVITSDDLLELTSLPERVVIVGGSVVGVEFACILHALGVEVTILGRRSFLRDAEQQLAKRLRSMLSRRGMSVTIGLEFKQIVQGPDGALRVEYERRGKAEFAEGDRVLIATGRWPYTEGLGLEEAGVRLQGDAIQVNARLQTSVPDIYAIGDCIGGLMLAHVASYEAEVAVENALGGHREADYRVVPNCIFTMPEIADVGITEEQAKEMGIAVNVTRFPFSVNGRALALGETEGQVRMICEREGEGGGRVLGVHIMGPRASDLIAEAALAMRLGATAQDIAETIHAHPTVPEAFMEAAMAQGIGAIHYQNR
jgi:dihydrolipoamide dehydrogenase